MRMPWSAAPWLAMLFTSRAINCDTTSGTTPVVQPVIYVIYLIHVIYVIYVVYVIYVMYVIYVSQGESLPSAFHSSSFYSHAAIQSGFAGGPIQSVARQRAV